MQPESRACHEPVRCPGIAASPSRVHYVVRAAAGRWEVVFGDSGACFVFAARGVALRAARGAARRQWQARGMRSAVTLEETGHARIVAHYGT